MKLRTNRRISLSPLSPAKQGYGSRLVTYGSKFNWFVLEKVGILEYKPRKGSNFAERSQDITKR